MEFSGRHDSSRMPPPHIVRELGEPPISWGAAFSKARLPVTSQRKDVLVLFRDRRKAGLALPRHPSGTNMSLPVVVPWLEITTDFAHT